MVPTPASPILGTLADEVLDGTGLADVIRGDGTSLGPGQRGGDDTIDAGAGNDGVQGDAATLNGAGGGDDRIDAGTGDDLVAGDALVFLPAFPGTILPVVVAMGDDTVHGGDGNDTLHGDLRSPARGVRYGDDLLEGGAGDDVLYGDHGLPLPSAGGGVPSGASALSGAAAGLPGMSTIGSGAGSDTLRGGAGDDSLYGNLGGDLLEGGRGADRLFGGTGNDTMTGGRGGDLFVIHPGDGHDLITDFDPGQDRLVFAGFGDGAALPALEFDRATTGLRISWGAEGDSVFLLGVTAIATTDVIFA